MGAGQRKGVMDIEQEMRRLPKELTGVQKD
jgi:hypothetical protein